MQEVQISEIVVPTDRQRQDVDPNYIQDLASSIRVHGLLQPIILRGNQLVVGECRLEAHKLLKKQTILARQFDDLDEDEAYLAEFEENFRRRNLTWVEEANAVYDFNDRMAGKKDSWKLSQTALAMGMSLPAAQKRWVVGRELKHGNKQVLDAGNLTAAYNVIQRIRSRASDKEVASFLDAESPMPSVVPEDEEDFGLDRRPVVPQIVGGARPAVKDLVQGDALEFFEAYSGDPFNFIHCDFPYGIEHNRSGQGSAKLHGAYDDSEQVFWTLLDGLLTNHERIMGAQCHVMFWFSMRYYVPILQRIAKFNNEHEPGHPFRLSVNPTPLIWFKNDNTGILPDPQRGPRQVYETAFLMTRGDRKVVKATSNVCAFPGRKGDDSLHISEKPQVMLEHFFKMLVDGSSRVLDPTCGSGNAIVVADYLGADQVMGWELDVDYYERAVANLNKSRMKETVRDAANPEINLEGLTVD